MERSSVSMTLVNWPVALYSNVIWLPLRSLMLLSFAMPRVFVAE